MKTWKLVSGIISMEISLVVIFQSCAVGILEAMGAEGSDSASGIIVAILLIAGGVVSVATRKGGRDGDIAIISIYVIAAIIGFTAEIYTDLIVWAAWCCICVLLAVVSLVEGTEWPVPQDDEEE